jgi:cytochrome c biogenesis protein CcmG/thiol:disulfide interchange protein DsbE
MRNRLVTGGVLVGVGVLIAIGWAQRDRFAPTEVGARAPEFTARSLEGDSLSLESLRGQVVLLNFWATWCAPCRREMPSMQRLYRELKSRGLEVVAVSVDAAPGGVEALAAPGGKVREFVEEYGLTFRVLLDPNGKVEQRYRATGLPTTFLIGRDGRIRDKVIGGVEWDEPAYAERVRRLLDG